MDENESKTLAAFMAPKAKPITDVAYVASDRFVDKDGNPIPWILHPIGHDKEMEIRGLAQKGKTFMERIYIDLMVAESVKSPNLGNAALQDSYHVEGKTALLEKMLTGTEYSLLMVKVQEISGMMRGVGQIKAIKNA